MQRSWLKVKCAGLTEPYLLALMSPMDSASGKPSEEGAWREMVVANPRYLIYVRMSTKAPESEQRDQSREMR